MTMDLSSAEFLIGEAWTNIKRNALMAAASVSNVAVSLTILGAFLLVALNLHYQAQTLARQGRITADLDDTVPVAKLEGLVWKDRRVERVDFRSKDRNLRTVCDWYNWDYEDVRAVLGNPLPDSLVVAVKRPEDIEAVAASIKNLDGVKDVRYAADVMAKLHAVRRAIERTGLVVGGLLVFATLSIVHTTIRLTVYARRREIRIMQLVGATNWFIRLPFLLEGVWCGFVGGLAAAVILLLGYTYAGAYIEEHFPFLKLIESPALLSAIGIGAALGGAAFGAIGTIVAMRRYLRII
jgi:cell division transport system permease protein